MQFGVDRFTGKGVLAIPSRVIATSFALVSFATAIVVGVFVGNDMYTILGRAVVIMFGCYLIGLGVGRIAQWTVDDHIRQYQEKYPIPTEPTESFDEADPAAGESRAAA